MRIHVITAGGTIDKQYNAKSGGLDIGAEIISRVLHLAGVNEHEVYLSCILQKDSMDITDAERTDLVKFIIASPLNRILVTHGTDTIEKTAQLINHARNKTIVLTGAMVPYSMNNSDASFNIGFAYAATQLLPIGVYIAMHGKVLPYTQYTKDRAAGKFVAVK